MTSVRKLARLAGVAPTTVSRALRNDPHVLPETRQRILELANLYHYRPDRVMQVSRSGNDFLIGCVMPPMNCEYYALIMQGVIEKSFSESFRAITLHSRETLQTHRAIQTLIEMHVSGIILACQHFDPVPNDALMEIRSHDIVPLVIENGTFTAAIDRVIPDEMAIGKLAVEYLHDLGHAEMLYVGFSQFGPGSSRYGARWLGVQQAMKKRGLPTDRIVEIQDIQPTEVWFREIFQRPHPPTAIIAFNDDVAVQILQQASHHGLHVPRDVSIIGCGDLRYGPFLVPPLTTINQHPEEIGSFAAEMMIKRISEKDADEDFEPTVLKVQPHLVKRGSCASPRRHKLPALLR